MTAGRREKLDIVFELGSTSDSRVLKSVISAGNFSAFFVDGRLISVEELSREVAERSKWSQVLEADGLGFRFGIVKAYKHCFIQIQELRPNAVGHWGSWVAPFLVEPGFVQAWVSDIEYDYWQNAEDPLLFETAGRDYSHLPTTSNGLPAPLGKQIIDISKNPGRWSMKQGYVEAMGAVMWLGPVFFRHVGADVHQSLLSSSWPEVEVVQNDVLMVRAATACFKDESNAALQIELRKRLYKHQ